MSDNLNETCQHCYGTGGRYDDDSQDQWYWCEHCDASKRYYERIKVERLPNKSSVADAIRTRLEYGLKKQDNELKSLDWNLGWVACCEWLLRELDISEGIELNEH